MTSEFFNLNRIGRTQFLAYTNIMYTLAILVFYQTFGFDNDLSSSIEYFSEKPYLFSVIAVLLLIPLKFLFQRFRDCGLNGWWALVGVVPHTFSFLYLLLGFYRGENYSNKYGDIPEGTGFFLKVIAFLPIILVTCVLAWYFLAY